MGIAKSSPRAGVVKDSSSREPTGSGDGLLLGLFLDLFPSAGFEVEGVKGGSLDGVAIVGLGSRGVRSGKSSSKTLRLVGESEVEGGRAIELGLLGVVFNGSSGAICNSSRPSDIGPEISSFLLAGGAGIAGAEDRVWWRAFGGIFSFVAGAVSGIAESRMSQSSS